MVTTIVQFPLPAGLSAEQYRAACQSAAPRFQGVPGLVCKQFLLAEDGRAGGGAYLWASRVAAEAFYAAGFREMIRERFGVEPTITFFETPTVVDNRPAA